MNNNLQDKTAETNKDKPLWYQPSTESLCNPNEKWLRLYWKFIGQSLFTHSPKIMNIFRCWILRKFGAKIGHHVYLAKTIVFTKPWELEIGNHVSIDEGCYINAAVTIKDHVGVSKCVKLISDGHNVRSRGFEYYFKRITIEPGAFIGADTFVGMGVTIGQFACIGSHSHVVKDIPENTIAFGTPCKVYSERIPEQEYEKYRFY